MESETVNLPCHVCDTSIVNVGHKRKRYRVLSVIKEYRVQTSNCKHHPIRETEEDKKKQIIHKYDVMWKGRQLYLVRGTAPLVCGRSSNKTGQHLTHTVGFSGPGS